jgi:hypothetical protein
MRPLMTVDAHFVRFLFFDSPRQVSIHWWWTWPGWLH